MADTQTTPAPVRASRLTGLAATLPALSARLPRPTLPSQEVVRRHGLDLLADLLKAVQRAETEATRTAREWASSQPGGKVFAEVLEADRRWALGFLEWDHPREVPDDCGPLHLFLTEGQVETYIRAWHAQTLADFALAKVRDCGSSPEVRDHLDRLTDDLRDRMRGLFELARDQKDREPYDQAVKLAPTWAEASGLWEWSQDTTRAHRNRSPRSIPQDLARVEFEAATALGETRLEIPDAALTDLPQNMVTRGGRRTMDPEPLIPRGGQR